MPEEPHSIMVGASRVALRPPTEADVPAILTFARMLPAHDLLFLPTDLTEEGNVRTWVSDSIKGASLSTLALQGTEVVGYSALARNGVAWMSHVADLRLIVAQSMRRSGLGRALTLQAVNGAIAVGIEKIMAQMTMEQDDAVKMFRGIGFHPEAVLRDQVKDRDGELHDLIVMSHYTGQLLSAFGMTATADGYVSTAHPMPHPDDVA